MDTLSATRSIDDITLLIKQAWEGTTRLVSSWNISPHRDFLKCPKGSYIPYLFDQFLLPSSVMLRFDACTMPTLDLIHNVGARLGGRVSAYIITDNDVYEN